MKEINCNIIKDIIPLYIDNIVSEDTRELVEEHLANCRECRTETEIMEKDLVIPVEDNMKPLKRLKRVLRNKKIIISLVSIILTAVLLMSVFFMVFQYEVYLPYSEDIFSIETLDDGTLASNTSKDNHNLIFALPLTMEIDGVEKNIVFLYYSQTIFEKYLRNLFNKDNAKNEFINIFPLGKGEEIDAVYYMNKPLKNLDFEVDWKEILKESTLIWENN